MATKHGSHVNVVAKPGANPPIASPTSHHHSRNQVVRHAKVGYTPRPMFVSSPNPLASSQKGRLNSKMPKGLEGP